MVNTRQGRTHLRLYWAFCPGASTPQSSGSDLHQASATSAHGIQALPHTRHTVHVCDGEYTVALPCTGHAGVAHQRCTCPPHPSSFPRHFHVFRVIAALLSACAHKGVCVATWPMRVQCCDRSGCPHTPVPGQEVAGQQLPPRVRLDRARPHRRARRLGTRHRPRIQVAKYDRHCRCWTHTES